MANSIKLIANQLTRLDTERKSPEEVNNMKKTLKINKFSKEFMEKPDEVQKTHEISLKSSIQSN